MPWTIEALLAGADPAMDAVAVLTGKEAASAR